MRGRRPKELNIAPSDLAELQRIARSEVSPWFRVRRARIVLGIAAGRRREVLASQCNCSETTVWRTCEGYRHQGRAYLLGDQRRGHSGRDLQITPVQRAQIVELACLEPVAKGLHITHWSSDDLARQAVADGIVAGISPRTVRKILRNVDLQPHRTRYWKTPRLDARFKERAEQVLWCYGNAARLAEQGIWVVCVDEIPTFQVLERDPIRRAIPGSIEQQEFDYTRHGTVNMLVFLVVHTGLMELVFLEQNDHEHYLPELILFRKHHQGIAKGLLDSRWRPEPYRRRNTPLLCQEPGVVETSLYASQRLVVKPSGDPDSCVQTLLPEAGIMAEQEEFKTHVLASWPEYNHRYAHPFEWTWTNQKMRQWFAKHAAGI